MKKYYLKNGKEVQIGDIIGKKDCIETPIGDINISKEFLISESMLEYLIKEGIIEERESKKNTKEGSKEKISEEVTDYIIKVTDRIDAAHPIITIGLLKRLHIKYPSAAYSMILKEIAIALDKKYPDHISDSPEIYTISTLNGKICKVPKGSIKSYNNFAAFRTIEDARFACKITKDFLKEMFKDGKQKDKGSN